MGAHASEIFTGDLMVGLGGLEISIEVVGRAPSSHPGHLISSIRNFYLRVGTWLCGSDCRRDPIDLLPNDRPSRIAQDHDRNRPVREILLVADVLVCCQKDFKGGFFCCS